MSNKPPPVPLSATGQNPNKFASVASIISLTCPLIILVLGLVCGLILPHLSVGMALIGMLVLGLVSLLLLVVGPILGILALLFMKDGGRGRIVACSLAGLVLTGGLLALALPNAMKARARTLAQRDASLKAIADQKAAAATAKTNAPTVSVKKFTQPQDEVAKSNPAENELVQKAGSAYMLRIQAVQGAYKNSLAALSAAHVLSTKDLTSRDIIEQRREVVHNFLKCNANLKNFYSASEDNFRGELARLNVSQPTIEVQMAGFHKSTAPRLPVLLAMRKQDDDMGRGMLAVLDLLEATWGHWSYDESTGHVRFENQAFVEQYNIDLRDINEAVQQGELSKKQLTKATTQPPAQ